MVNVKYNQWKNDKLLYSVRGDELENDSTIFIMKLILVFDGL